MSGGLRPRLLVVQGGRTLEVREILPGEDWTLGRSPESPLPLAERSISRMHVRIFCDATGVHLEDLGTPNGTFIDGKQVEGVVTLRDGNTIRLGQSTNPDPLLLRFEDPGGRLLEVMVVPASPPVEKPPEPPPVVSAAVEEAPSNVAPAEAAEPPAPARPSLLRAHGKAGVVALAAAGVLAWLIPQWRQHSWTLVRVEPLRVRAGTRVTLRGDDVQPSDRQKVFVADQEARIEEKGPGLLAFAVPALGGAEAGFRPVTLRVESSGFVHFQHNVQMETLPEVRSVEPREAAVGDTVTLKGSGFASEPGRIKVRLGQVVAPVLATSPSEVQIRVPVVTRNVVVELPVEVKIGEWSSAPTPLFVRPREAPCYPLAFTPRQAAPRIWEIRHPLGVAAYAEASAPADDGAAPPRIQQAADALRAAFAKAGSDPNVRFEVRDSGRSPALVAIGLGPAPLEIVRWSPALVSFIREKAPQIPQASLVPYWSAVVLNELLNVFAKKQPARLLPADTPLRPVLERLNRLSLDTGGQGCPSASEIETLAAGEREAFESALASPPARFGAVAGAWEGSLENLFAEGTTDTTLEFRLELEQNGTQLKGRAKVAQLRGPGIKVWLPPVEGLEGRVRLGSETRIELTGTPAPPFHLTRVNAVASDNALEGTLFTARSKQGRFQLHLVPE